MDSTPLSRYITHTLARAVAKPFAGSPRWAAVPLIAGVTFYGVVFGRRWAGRTGFVPMLALRADGLLEPTLVPTDDRVHTQPEQDVRAQFVRHHKLRYAPRGHAFEPSPVHVFFCTLCAESESEHLRAQARLLIEKALGTNDVRITFADAGAQVQVASVEVCDRVVAEPAATEPAATEPAATEPAATEPAATEPAATEPAARYVRRYRPLTAEEWHLVVRALGVKVPRS